MNSFDIYDLFTLWRNMQVQRYCSQEFLGGGHWNWQLHNRNTNTWEIAAATKRSITQRLRHKRPGSRKTHNSLKICVFLCRHRDKVIRFQITFLEIKATLVVWALIVERLIEGIAKCRRLKNSPVKGLCVRCLSVGGPEPLTYIRVYIMLIHTGKGGGVNQREG